MLTREQAYKDYLDKYRAEIDNMIHKANGKHKTHINISADKPKEIIDELKEAGYKIKEFDPNPIKLASGRTLQMPVCYEISWDENK